MKAFSMIRRFSEQKDSNWAMIRREMIADVIQTCLKATAFTLSNSQAVKAELMRAGLDAMNHVFMLIANKWSKYNPDEKYNYGDLYSGYSKFKNITVIIPGLCFALSGVYNVVTPILSLTGDADLPELFLNPLSLSIIFISSFGEFYLYYKNLGDVSLNDAAYSFINRLIIRTRLSYRIILKKDSVDPIQDAIITENVLAVLGVTMPVLTSFMCFATGLNWMDSIGEFSNGVVQIYLGYLICKENTQILAGKSVGANKQQKILEILQNRNEIKEVSNLRTRWTNETLEISANIVYNEKELADYVVKGLENEIKMIGGDTKVTTAIKRLVGKSASQFIVQTSQIVHYMEEDVRKLFPSATFIDIEKTQPLNHDEEEGKKHQRNEITQDIK